jgi:hypothetical protein
VEALPAIITGIVDFVIGAVPQVVEAFVGLLTSVVEALPGIIETIVAALPELITGIVTAITEAVPQIVEAGITLLTALIDALPEIITTIVEALPQIIDAILTAITEAVPQLIDAGIELLTALVEALPDIITAVVEAIHPRQHGAREFLRPQRGVRAVALERLSQGPGPAAKKTAIPQAPPTAPSAPQNFTATPDDGSVTLAWTAPASTGGAAITGYQVSNDDGSAWAAADSDTGHTFTGLTNDQSYTFQVRAQNSAGNGPAATATATPVAGV